MASTFDFASLTAPVAAKAPIKRVVTRVSKDKAPNPFVVNGWLAASKDRDTAYDIAAVGMFTEYEKKTRKGELTKDLKVTGDAYHVTQLLRQASDELGIGVRLEYINSKGVAVKSGKIAGIRYLGTKRKEAKKVETPAVA